MNKVYFISGLGADKRTFSFLDLSFCDPIYIEWIEPCKNETLESYALRLRKKIPETNPIVIGISFGGMLVTEMAKSDKNIKAIIISSNKTKKEFPKFLRLGRYFPLYKWLPSNLFRKMILVFKSILGAKGNDPKRLLKQVLIHTNIKFVKWAIGSILDWQNKNVPENLIHIHGTADKLLPYKLVKADYTIPNGTHLMIMDRHEEISSLLKKLIA